MTLEEHVAEAERLAALAAGRDHIFARSADLQAAQVHATLAAALTSAKVMPLMERLVKSVEDPHD